MLYHLYELTHATVAPFRIGAEIGAHAFSNPFLPISYTPAGRFAAAGFSMFERLTRRYDKPRFGIADVTMAGRRVAVDERVVLRQPFGQLKHFRKAGGAGERQPKLLLVAPLSGHYATLLRGTVRALLPEHDVYVTDWRDARMVPLACGGFDLNDYIDYLIGYLRHLGPDVHLVAVCQPGPAALAATALMAEDEDPCQPASLVLMGSPIDTRRSPTVPNRLATERPLSWFRRNVIMHVPPPHPGWMRQVYPGFLQLTGFMTMNLDRHIDAHLQLFQHLVDGDGDGAEQHRRFYDEYLAVMDLPAEFYLQTVREIFQEHRLAEGRMRHHGRPVRPQAIRRTALMTVEGERDDISGIGQTQAAHALCSALPARMQEDYVQPEVGHYGVFNGRRWREEIAPRIADFVRRHPRLA